MGNKPNIKNSIENIFFNVGDSKLGIAKLEYDNFKIDY